MPMSSDSMFSVEWAFSGWVQARTDVAACGLDSASRASAYSSTSSGCFMVAAISRTSTVQPRRSWISIRSWTPISEAPKKLARMPTTLTTRDPSSSRCDPVGTMRIPVSERRTPFTRATSFMSVPAGNRRVPTNTLPDSRLSFCSSCSSARTTVKGRNMSGVILSCIRLGFRKPRRPSERAPQAHILGVARFRLQLAHAWLQPRSFSNFVVILAMLRFCVLRRVMACGASTSVSGCRWVYPRDSRALCARRPVRPSRCSARRIPGRVHLRNAR